MSAHHHAEGKKDSRLMIKVLNRMRAKITKMLNSLKVLKGMKHTMVKKLMKRMKRLKKMRSLERMKKPIGRDYMLAFANKRSNGC